MLVSLSGGREQLVLSPELAPTGRGRAALLVPVPADATATPLPAARDALFGGLERATSPLGRGGRTAAGPLPRAAVADYAVQTLPAGDAGALRRWLAGPGAGTPSSARALLRGYVRRGWGFVGIRLSAAASAPGRARALRPLRIAFAADRLVVPLRLGQSARQPVSVELYVGGPHRVVARGFDTFHAGRVADLRPAPGAGSRALIGGPFLTRLGLVGAEPATLTADVAVRRGVSDRLFRASAAYPYESEEGFATAPTPAQQAEDAPLTDAPGGAAWLLLFPLVGVITAAVFALARLRGRRRAPRP
nr:DUF2330 domain-containing protein [Patulibacter sp. SYSU D01012]